MNFGIGTLIGMASADEDTRVAQHQHDLQRMRDELAKKMSEVVYQTAFKEAAATVQEDIIEELRRDARLKARRATKRQATSVTEKLDLICEENDKKFPLTRLSDPQNIDARNKAYAEYAAEAVTRISAGQITMSHLSIDRVRNNRTIR